VIKCATRLGAEFAIVALSVTAACVLFVGSTSSAAQSPTLGADWANSGGGFGAVRPILVSNGGDPSGVVSSISWKSWGGARATGVGSAEYVASDETTANGTLERAIIVAFNLGVCGGVSAYTAVEWYFPEEGQTFESDEYENACDYYDTPKFVPSRSNVGQWLSPSLVITPRALGTVKVGMTLIGAMRAAGIAIMAAGDGDYSPQYGVGPTDLVLSLNSSGKVDCVAVGIGAPHTPSVSTQQGFLDGETVAQLKRVYGHLLRYVPARNTGLGAPSGYILTTTSGRLAFNTNSSGRVEGIEAGPDVEPGSC
jgi:hypothetical protein